MLPTREEPLVDVNGVPFVQESVFSFRKNIGLYLKVTQQTKADIEYLCCKKRFVNRSPCIRLCSFRMSNPNARNSNSL